jgi:hypothetical protein
MCVSEYSIIRRLNKVLAYTISVKPFIHSIQRENKGLFQVQY